MFAEMAGAAEDDQVLLDVLSAVSLLDDVMQFKSAPAVASAAPVPRPTDQLAPEAERYRRLAWHGRFPGSS